ncbi:putative membrane protein YdjX (TVP38/TMEM64 family) [Planomicrobium soli]|uniref:TVP38/TMEM64 family membrane protein n=1 Tax=Planomicrobium soli TaxID=1176648 RepID=A0A2P8H5W4_9BACL|nr:VTT domain-containing protein [Planomicrobium soli]PSL41622.1 putative membrane protein YdjX (TVP38/TMEM64 family) [Planomicrobium soli]
MNVSLAAEFILLLLLNMAVGAFGFFPSFFVTTLNINLFGLSIGTFLSLSGEIFGAILGFYLYRLGFTKMNPAWRSHRFWLVLENQPANRVFWSVIGLRLIPFVPSGLVTAGASLTPISPWRFAIASTIGKIPAVFLEIAVAYGYTQSLSAEYQYGIVAAVLVISLVVWLLRKRKSGLR